MTRFQRFCFVMQRYPARCTGLSNGALSALYAEEPQTRLEKFTKNLAPMT
jgi:hypothetical protein